MNDQVSRKDAIISLLSLPIVASAVAATTGAASAQTLDPKTVGYIPKSKIKGKYCSNCALFVKPNKCTQVKGVIAPAGYCNIYAPAAK
jgi:ribosomal protein S26